MAVVVGTGTVADMVAGTAAGTAADTDVDTGDTATRD